MKTFLSNKTDEFSMECAGKEAKSKKYFLSCCTL